MERKMDWRIFFVTFGTVFLAELGDKTQLATLMFSTQTKSPIIVFAGAAAALVLSSFIAVAAGQFADKYIPTRVIQTIAGVSFVAIGFWVIYSVFKGGAA
jgi:Ca2+/H+ antiporter, TMEM165/GDT1 family